MSEKTNKIGQPTRNINAEIQLGAKTMATAKLDTKAEKQVQKKRQSHSACFEIPHCVVFLRPLCTYIFLLLYCG